MSASRCSECGAVRMTSEEPFTLNAAPGTRHHRLLTSNEVPLESDSTIVQSVISKARAGLALIEQEISRLRDRMKYLEEERASLSGHIAILSPLRRIPPEVLGEIFSWTLPSADALKQKKNFDIAESPWVLTRVSAQWRAVALSLPSLWSLVVVEFPENPRPLPIVKAHIQRAQSLKIHFYGDQESDSWPQIELFLCLAEHSSRWQEFSIRITSDLFPLLTGLRNRLASLCRLSIEWDDPDSQTWVESIDCFQVAPSLVDAASFSEHRYVQTLLPSHQLIRYDLDGPWEIHRGILMLAPNLVEARIWIDFDEDGGWPDSGEIIHLLRLQRLFVSHEDILKYIRTPALQEIGFHVDRERPRYLPLLDPFMSRSSCTLRRLCFEGSPTTLAADEILRNYPSITELAILHHHNSSRRRTRDLISHLVVPDSPGSTTVSPQLSGISFGRHEDDGSIDHTIFLDMLQSRWKAKDCALKSAALLTDSETDPDSATLCRLDELRREGLDLLVLRGAEASLVMDDWTYKRTWT